MTLILPFSLYCFAFALFALPTSVVSQPDFIVVGAGTAGCTFAGTLCRRLPRAHIVLLERGKPRNTTEELYSRSPRLVFDAWGVPSLTQTFLTEPDETVGGQRLRVYAGNTLGGGSAVNAMQVTLPERGTYSTWDVARFNDRVADRLFARVRSLLNVRVLPLGLRADYKELLLRASARAGAPVIDPYSGKRRNDGMWVKRATMDTSGRRVDACRAFILNQKLDCKLDVIQDTLVEKILVKKCSREAPKGKCRGRLTASRVGTPCARGVMYKTRFGKSRTLHAKREVIVAAGAIESPKILQLSGIGPADLLKSLHIRPVADLPVGKRLQTRTVSEVLSFYSKVPLAKVNNLSVVLSDDARKQFDAGQGGPLGTSMVISNSRFPPYGYANSKTGVSIGSSLANHRILSSVCLSNPARKTRATLKAVSKDAAMPPSLKVNLFKNRQDRRNLVQCLQRLRKIHQQLAAPMGMVESVPDGVSPADLDDDTVFESILRKRSYGLTHLTGSCAVGHVVNKFLRVKRVQGLRVVDSSAIPYIPPSAGPYASVVLLAKHAAETIVAQQYQCLA